MGDLLTISDAASKSIKEKVFPTLAENHLRTGTSPVLQMFGWEDKAVDQMTGAVNRPRVQPVKTVQAGNLIDVVHEHSLFGGGYAVAEDVSLEYGKRAEDRSQATIRFYEGAFKLSRASIAASRNNDIALVEQVSRHALNSLRQAQKDFSRMATHKRDGIVAYVNTATTSSTTVTVDNGGTSEGTATRYIFPTGKYWIGTTSAIEAGTADEVEVSSITSATKFVVSSAGNFADDDVIVRKNVYASSAYREFACLEELIDTTGTIQNVNKATNFWFASQKATSVGTLAISDIDSIITDVRDYANDPKKVFIQGNKTQWRRYSDLLTANKRSTTHKAQGMDGMFGAGASQLTYFAPDGDYPVFLATDMADGEMQVVDTEGYFFAEMHPFGFLEDALQMNGATGQRISGQTNYEFPFVHYGQIVQTNARASGRLTGITG